MNKEVGWRGYATVVFFACAATVLFALYGFSGMFQRAYHIFAFAEEEDMSFGWFVPLFSAYVIWTDRRRIADSMGLCVDGTEASPHLSWSGFAMSIVFICLGILGTRGVQLRLEQLGFIGLCVTIPWTFFGWRCGRLFLFPAAYLLFCIPLATFLDFVTIHLRYLASSTALTVLNGFGFAAIREGTAVISRGAHPFAVDVAEPCSGLRSLFALMALTAGYAYFNQQTWLRRGILFACSVPLAVAGNVARIVSICVIASCSDPKFATGFYHDYSGYIVFIVAISLMVLVGELIDRICGIKPAGESANKGKGDIRLVWPKFGMGHVWGAVCVAAFFVGMFVFQAMTPAATIAKAPVVGFSEIDGYLTDDKKFAEQQEISEGEKKILPKDTAIFKKMYVSPDGGHFLATFVVGGTSRASIHRPELCLPSQGYVMSNPRNIEAGGWTWHIIDIMKYGGDSGMQAYTFFNQEGFRTASHTRRIWQDVIDRSVFNRVDRWVMVTVNAVDATETDLRKFLDRFGRCKWLD